MANPPVDLGLWHTPLEPADRLGVAIGLRAGDLHVKRDDWLGLGGGGNKLRKLAPLLARAVAGGATHVVAPGAAQSNFARLTAASARRLGLDVTLVLARAEAGGGAGGNLVLDGLLAADVVWADGSPADLADAAARTADAIRAHGGVPAILPFGGSDAIGATGYVACARELLADLPDLALAVVPVGSGGTMAGLVAELGPDRVLGGHAGAVEDPRAAVAALTTSLAPRRPVTPEALRLDTAVVGDGYEHPTAQSRRAMDLAARHEGILLDPVYGAKGFAALIDAVARGEVEPGTRTALVLTGGLPGLLGHPLAAELAARTQPGGP